MKGIDVLGLPLKEGLQLISCNTDNKINILETYGLNKRFNQELCEPRILRVSFTNNTVNLVVGYF